MFPAPVQALEYISLHNITYATQYYIFLYIIYYQLDANILILLKCYKTTFCAFVDF